MFSFLDKMKEKWKSCEMFVFGGFEFNINLD